MSRLDEVGEARGADAPGAVGSWRGFGVVMVMVMVVFFVLFFGFVVGIGIGGGFLVGGGGG